MFGLSSSRSQSSSLDFGVQGSESASFSLGSSQALSGGQSTSQQSIAFEELFRSLFGGATGAAAKVSEATPLFQGEAQQLFSGGLGFLEQLTGGADTQYLADRVAGPDTAAAAQLGALGQGLGDFFNEQLLPGIASRSIASGGYGGARMGVAQSLAAKQVAGQYAQGAASILGQSQAARDAAAGTLGGLRTQAAGIGLNALPGILGLAQAGTNAALSPYLALSQILGGPTVLTSAQSSQFGQSSSQELAQALSESFGFNFGTSQSTSKGKSFSVGGFGGGGKS